MALRAGDAITAAAWFAQAAASFLPNEAWGFQQSSDDIISEEFVTPVCRIHAEQAILALNRDDYLQAMWLMYQAKENYWPDVAHIAERVLTVNELIAFVDKYVPAPSPSDLNMPKNAGRESADQATQSARTTPDAHGPVAKALAYFALTEDRDAAQAFINALPTKGHKKLRRRAGGKRC
jgi:hypothetical protein